MNASAGWLNTWIGTRPGQVRAPWLSTRPA